MDPELKKLSKSQIGSRVFESIEKLGENEQDDIFDELYQEMLRRKQARDL